MPIYEYQCSACDHKFEKLQKMSDEPLRDCPECSEAALNKLISAAGFQLKGSGWYVTDFKDSGKNKSSSNNKDAAKSGGSTASAENSSKSSNKTSSSSNTSTSADSN
ncbi:MAG: zinc ribbon domain-containing protein [Gammaproteobacteria bacterium]|nr:zinc ribbon domain-containing protein [Gammaproteobacteria bacterium]